ncbi:hypothetical protein T492DRAFT_979202 [Pavlovales sp. CCMP2436]|nr:hypothetical protein T492DRAFT_979202 [Pavlovales sp. CCMP2436]
MAMSLQIRIALGLACTLAACGAFKTGAPTVGLRRACATSRPLARPCLRMSEEPTGGGGLKFEELDADIDDSEGISQDEAMEMAMGRKEVPDEVAEKKIELMPESALSEDELRDRRRLLAVKKYAPWMADSVSDEAIAERERAERDRKNKKVEKLVGNRIDPAKQEISGSGLKIRVDAGDEGGSVRLEWSTGGEDSNLGFIIARKGPGSNDFVDIADYQRFQTLRSKGAAGGSYAFVDEDVPTGPYLYKVMDVAVGSNFMTEVCRKGIEVENKSEQSGTAALVGGFLAVAALLYAVGTSLDPQQ